MANLANSQRSLNKATYVPTRARPGSSTNTPRVLEKTAAIRQLNLQVAELDRLAANADVKKMTVGVGNVTKSNQAGNSTTMPLIDVVRNLVTNISSGSTQRYAPLLMNVKPEQIIAFTRVVASERQAVADAARVHATKIQKAFSSAVPLAMQSRLKVTKWAMANNVPAANELLKLAKTHGPFKNNDAEVSVDLFPGQSQDLVVYTQNLLDWFQERFQVEPVGRLHLERLEMTPVGIEHGELVHSVPLTPKETVNISHREWSVTSQTFENIVEDSLEGFSEQGVVDKTDIAQAVTNESRHSSSLDVNGNVSASYTGAGYSVTASAGVDYGTKSDDFRSTKDSLAHSLAMTRTASSRTRKEHKSSFRVSSVAGTEDMAVQVLTNPSDTNAMRVDYYQLMRKWRVDLIRYGLRLTYDIVVPNPGNDLAQKVMELQSLIQAIASPHDFVAADGTPVAVGDITPDSWSSYAQQFSANLDAPPQDPIEMMQTGTFQTSIDKFTFGPVDFDIPDGYAVSSGQFTAQVHIGDGDFGSDHRAQIGLEDEAAGAGTSPMDSKGQFNDKDGVLQVPLTENSIVKRTGKVSLLFKYYNVESGGWIARVQASPTPATLLAWKVKAWNQLRDADEAAYQAGLQRMKDRKSQLEAELGQFDALTLRKMEREEIMKSVLRWLFGPSFQLQPGALDLLLTDPQQAVFQPKFDEGWQAIMLYGEFIKFIHNAIEWENVIFFPYPYFWDATSRWPFKQFLVHPDSEHRTFLRAGCARVVLTVRPGFEKDFTQFVETGSFTAVLPGDHPYVSIAEEIRNFAMTNYQGIPPANPDKNARPLLFPQQRKTWEDMQKLMLLLEAYSNDPKNNPDPEDASKANANKTVYPTTADGLGVLSGYVPLKDSTGKVIVADFPTADFWGKAFVYTSPGLHGDYDLASYGADGAEGGDGLDGDITSWAEGSVVATWFEYTPTSALDVVVNSALPTIATPA